MRALPVCVALCLLACSQVTGAPGGGGDPDLIPLDGEGDLCVRPREGCPCDQVSPIDCYGDPIVGDDGRTLCARGTRYCRGGSWSACESVHRYELRSGPGLAPLITGPTECNMCDPSCFTSDDTPGPGDLGPGNSSGVIYDTNPGGIEIPPGPPMYVIPPDSDGDGVPDPYDDCPGVPESYFDPVTMMCIAHGNGFYFHLLPFGAPAVIDPYVLNVQVSAADVYFLMDTTGSMNGEIDQLQADLTTGNFLAGCSDPGIIGAIRCTIPDAWFGAGTFDDYAFMSYGTGGTGDVPFTHLQDIASDISLTSTAVNGMSAAGGGDLPESATQALYAAATGNGLGMYLAARAGCPATTFGYPCFRMGTIPIVILFTDAPFHNGSIAAYDYNSTSLPEAIPYMTVLSELNARSVRVISIISCAGGGSCDPDAENSAIALANSTGSVNSLGAPYMFPINSDGTGLGTAVVDAVVDLANYNRINITAAAVDNPATPAVDETGFITAITAQSVGAGNCASWAGNTFTQCLPGTDVNYSITFENNIVMPTMMDQEFNFTIDVYADGSYLLQSVPITIVVPAGYPTYMGPSSYWRDYDTVDPGYALMPPVPTNVGCAPNERPDWGSLTWTATTPSDSSIGFDISVADTLAALPGAPTVATVTVPGNSSPVDVGALLMSDNFRSFLRITANLYPSSDGLATPTLTGFQLTYTCVPSE